MQGGGTIHTSLSANKGRTFRSGPYLDSLFKAAEAMDARLQAEICARIKQARVEAGFTLQEAADTLGVTLRAWQNYEANRVPFRSLSRIAEITGVAESWLLRGGDEEVDAVSVEQILLRLRALEEQMAEHVALTREALTLLREAQKQAAVVPRSRRRASG